MYPIAYTVPAKSSQMHYIEYNSKCSEEIPIFFIIQNSYVQVQFKSFAVGRVHGDFYRRLQIAWTGTCLNKHVTFLNIMKLHCTLYYLPVVRILRSDNSDGKSGSIFKKLMATHKDRHTQ